MVQKIFRKFYIKFRESQIIFKKNLIKFYKKIEEQFLKFRKSLVKFIFT